MAKVFVTAAPTKVNAIKLEILPAELREKLSPLDRDGNGLIDPSEILVPEAESVSVKAFPKSVQEDLVIFDKSGDGKIDLHELQVAAHLYQNAKRTSRRLMQVVGGLAIIILFLIGIQTAMVFVVVDLSKDTEATNDMLIDRNSGEMVATGSFVLSHAPVEPSEEAAAAHRRLQEHKSDKYADYEVFQQFQFNAVQQGCSALCAGSIDIMINQKNPDESEHMEKFTITQRTGCNCNTGSKSTTADNMMATLEDANGYEYVVACHDGTICTVSALPEVLATRERVNTRRLLESSGNRHLLLCDSSRYQEYDAEIGRTVSGYLDCSGIGSSGIDETKCPRACWEDCSRGADVSSRTSPDVAFRGSVTRLERVEDISFCNHHCAPSSGQFCKCRWENQEKYGTDDNCDCYDTPNCKCSHIVNSALGLAFFGEEGKDPHAIEEGECPEERLWCREYDLSATFANGCGTCNTNGWLEHYSYCAYNMENFIDCSGCLEEMTENYVRATAAPTDPPTHAPLGPPCFPASATVVLENRQTVRMDELKVGHRVQAMDPSGNLVFSDMWYPGHEDAEVLGPYLQIKTESGRVIELSEGHYIPQIAAQSDAFEYAAAVTKQAKSVRVGDIIFQLGVTSQAEGQRVIAVEEVMRQGLYNPMILEGTIVVDGVVASSYSKWCFEAVIPQWMVGGDESGYAKFQHAWFAPLRFMYTVMGAEWTQNLVVNMSKGDLYYGHSVWRNFLGMAQPYFMAARGLAKKYLTKA